MNGAPESIPFPVPANRLLLLSTAHAHPALIIVTRKRGQDALTSTRRAAAAVCEQDDGQEEDLEGRTDQVNGPEPQSKPSALVIDDSIDIGFLLVMILQSAGYEAVMSTSAIDALALTEERHFDLVVSDIAMPDMDGYSLANALRSRPEYQHIPLVAVTGFDEYDDRQRALAAGFNTHVKKPIDPATFINVIRQLKS